jgi:sulfonate transport system substrate-binding protein
MVKRKLILMVITALLAALLSGCGGQGRTAGTGQDQQAKQSDNKREIRIAYQTASTVVLIGKAKGWYEEEFGKDGTAVKYDLFLSGPPMIEAFAGDRGDIGNVGDMPPVSAKSNGVDLKIVSRAGVSSISNQLLVRPDGSIKTVQDLKGKKVAVQIGSSAHHFLILLLNQNGLKTGDVNIVNLPATDQQAALESGNVDAAATWEPWGTSLEYAKAAKVLGDHSKIKVNTSVFIARNEFGRSNPDLVERFLRVNQRIIEYIKNNPEEALEIVSKESKLPVPVLRKSFLATDWEARVGDKDIQEFNKVKSFLKDTNVLKKDFDINELFDLHYLKNIGIQ